MLRPLSRAISALVCAGLATWATLQITAQDPPAPPKPPPLEEKLKVAGERASAVRGLPHRAAVEIQTVDRGKHAEELIDEVERSLGGKLEVIEAFLARTGFTPPKLKLRAALTLFASQNVGASYDKGRVRVFDDEVPDSTLVHEMVHALQEQNFALATIQGSTNEIDAGLAIQALVEGDADFAERLAMNPKATGDREALAKQMREESENSEQAARQAAVLTPLLFSRMQQFWYTRGEEFVAALHHDGGWEAVNRGYAAVPSSTEQILHPEKYRAGEGPIRLDLADLEATLISNGWAIRYGTTIGEILTEVWLEQCGPKPVDVEACFKAATGWGGDRAILAEKGEARLGLWLSTWDTPAEAAEFHSLAVKTLSGGTVLLRESDVLILFGCPEDRLSRIETDAWAAPHRMLQPS